MLVVDVRVTGYVLYYCMHVIIGLQESTTAAGSGEDDSAGVSAPLYDVVIAIFGLAGRGFFRRQVINPLYFLTHCV